MEDRHKVEGRGSQDVRVTILSVRVNLGWLVTKRQIETKRGGPVNGRSENNVTPMPRRCTSGLSDSGRLGYPPPPLKPILPPPRPSYVGIRVSPHSTRVSAPHSTARRFYWLFLLVSSTLVWHCTTTLVCEQTNVPARGRALSWRNPDCVRHGSARETDEGRRTRWLRTVELQKKKKHYKKIKGTNKRKNSLVTRAIAIRWRVVCTYTLRNPVDCYLILIMHYNIVMIMQQ